MTDKDNISQEVIDALTHANLSEEDVSELENHPTIKELINSFKKHPINYDDFGLDRIPDVKAYPNNNQYLYIPGEHNTQKWLQTVKDIFSKERGGIERTNAIRQSTAGWDIMETYDFLNWLRFYQEGTHLKYKLANLWYENGEPGYFLPIKKDTPEAIAPREDINQAKDAGPDEMSSSEKKRLIEKQRSKIIGRLDSAEKLLRSQEGQLFSGKEFESLLEAIYDLKKRIQLINKISTSTRLYSDLIVRQANIFTKQGFVKAANLLYTMAEETDNKKAIPEPTPPAPPAESSGAPGGLPSTGPGTPQTPPESAEQNPPNVVEEAPQPKGITQFLENLDAGNVEDVLEVSDAEILVTEAQEVPPPPPPPPTETKKGPATEAPLEVTEDDIPSAPKQDTTPIVKEFDSKVDALFATLTVADVVAKLEDLAKIFKTREVPRQLAIVDMMLDSLGLASFFPSLSEATNKSLESNNYISTRVEDIISKLRGAMKTHEVDLKGSENAEKPEVAGIKSKLQQDADKEKARKEMRKEQEAQELANPKETPEVEIEEDLSPKAPATPVKPPTPPTV